MSKEKPEVGDVWVRPSGIKYHITEIGSFFIGVMSESLMGYAFPKQHFNTEFTYLGKSKVSIKGLFDVADN